MATQIFHGKAQVTGCAATFDVVLYPIQQTMKANHAFELDTTNDSDGQDCAWRTYNEKVDGDVAFKLLGDTLAHAEAGAAFLAPLAVITISACKVALFNTTYCLMSGSDIDLANTKVGDMTFKLRRYVDPTQNILFATVPS